MIRGIERQDIFWNDKDLDNFIERLSTILPETKTLCYAWVLMTNHAHFLFRSGKTGISTVMRRLLTGYAVSFNHRHNRHGQLFQNRYKSIICQEDAYLRELVRYIHLNPLRANIVSSVTELNEYPYCGHATLMGRRKQQWQDTKYVLGYFDKNVARAKKTYLDFVNAGIEHGRRPELVGGGMIRSLGGWDEIKESQLDKNSRIKSDERILGDSEFVMQVLNEANEQYDRKYRLKALGYDLTKAEQRILGLFGISRKELYSGSRKKTISEARSVFCYWGVRELGESMTSIAKRLGLTQPAVGYAVDRGEHISKERKIALIE